MRVSILGGGSDYPNSIKEFGGFVVGTAINKYTYITARKASPFFDYQSKFIYSEIETVKSHKDIQHKAIAAVLESLKWPESDGIEISHVADLPSMSGMGSSSSFIVSMLNAISSLQNKPLLKDKLAQQAIYTEQEILREKVGYQDTIFATFGGLNQIKFNRDLSFDVYPLNLSLADLDNLEQHLMLFFTRITRRSSEVAATYVDCLSKQCAKQTAMIKLANDGLAAIYKGDMQTLGKIVNNSWQIKRSLSNAVSNLDLDRWHAKSILYGGFGGKITGSGGGGSLLVVCPPEKQIYVKKALEEEGLIHIPFRFEYDGSRIIFIDRSVSV